MKFSKKWLQEYVVEELPENKTIVDQLSKKAFEVEEVEEYLSATGESDYVFEIKILPNRAHDCLGHLGLARELAAIFNLTLKPEAVYEWGDLEKDENFNFIKNKQNAQASASVEFPKAVDIFVEDVGACTKFMSIRIEGIEVASSPTWLCNRLEAIGQRSINNIVDITNYVQFSLNKPMHAYDAYNIKGRLCALYAEEGEKLVTLDDKELVLDSQTLIIADEGVEGSTGSKALGLAGIKGGKFSGVSKKTNSIILESANFNPNLVRKTSQKYNIRTDASKRFENGIPDSLVAAGLYLTAKLILEIAGNENSKISLVTDIYPQKDNQKDVEINFNIKEVSRVAGRAIVDSKIIEILESLRLQTDLKNEGLKVTVPSERLDLRIKDDIIEEVIRLYGFDNIESKAINLSQKGVVNEVLAVETEIRKILINKGFSEIFGYAFTNKGQVEIALPLASDKAFLRTNLSTGAQKMFEKNILLAPLFESENISFFEFGNIFTKDFEERRCVIVKDDGKKKSKPLNELEDILEEVKSALSLTEIALIDKNEKPALIEFSILEIIKNTEPVKLKSLQENFSKVPYELPNKKYIPFSIYPFIVRDVSMWIPSNINFENIKKEMESLDLKNYLKSYVFDSYMPTNEANPNFGKTSLAFRLIFQSNDKTLTDMEVEAEMQKVYELLKNKGFEVR
jgi:phenylalanyl-tRNA synthetase beta chain